jgi:transcriptional regulator with XRE-family HTH domain
MVIETDDPSSVLFFQFFSDIQKFIDLYHFRLRSASQVDLYQKNGPTRMEQAYAAYTQQLTQYRKLPGTRMEKLRLLKGLRTTMGENVTLDTIISEIKIAIEIERKEKLYSIHQLSKEGYSLQQISNKIGLPKSTVSRYLKKVIPETDKDISPSPSMVLPLLKRYDLT